jgi:hypothetical protein
LKTLTPSVVLPRSAPDRVRTTGFLTTVFMLAHPPSG